MSDKKAPIKTRFDHNKFLGILNRYEMELAKTRAITVRDDLTGTYALLHDYHKMLMASVNSCILPTPKQIILPSGETLEQVRAQVAALNRKD